MSLNDYVSIQSTVAPEVPAKPASLPDRSEQVNIGLDYAKRQAEKEPPAAPVIPSAGAIPIPN